MKRQRLTLAYIVSILLLHVCTSAFGQHPHRTATTTFSIDSPKVDGLLDDKAWQQCQPLEGFTQWKPNRLKAATQSSEVRLLYTCSSIFVYARLNDTSPKGIAQQLGARDSYDSPSCDIFSIGINPYNDGVTSYYFSVSAAGVQSDRKVSGTTEDASWDAVWYSAVRVDSLGWSVEMEIPLTQLRFTAQKEEWGFNCWRLIKRSTEWDTFNPVDVNIQGINNQEATLAGLGSLKMPFRLSLSPYVSYSLERSHSKNTHNVKGGLDLRYGLSDAFTLDMMVIPDFSQVRSDDIQLNLTTVEQQLSENRQFFTEGSELFSRAGIFYSRRIGSTPINADKAYASLATNEVVSQQSSSTSIINAIKISGRTSNGLGVGFLNAVTADTYATIKDTLQGSSRSYRVQPLSSYNVVVVDMPIKNSSYVSLINANMLMPSTQFVFNNSATEFYLANKSQSYALKGIIQYAMHSDSGRIAKQGGAYSISVLKTAGVFRFELANTLYSNTYVPSYMGYLDQNNRVITYGKIQYLSYEQKPHTKYRFVTMYGTYERVYNPSRYSLFEVHILGGATYNSEFHHELEASFTPFVKYDYFEPRHKGYKYAEPRAMWWGYSFNTDTRKVVAISKALIGYWMAEKYAKRALYLQLDPTVRCGDRFTATAGFFATINKNAIGYVEDDAKQPNVPIFGRRDVQNYEQSAELRYILSKNSYTNVRARYNWTNVKYRQFYHLQADGWVEGIDFLQGRDINYTAATLEMNFAWNFAPGSLLSLMYRVNLQETSHLANVGYFDNWRDIYSMNHGNMLSFRLLYYWNYRKR